MEFADKFAIAELIQAWGLYRDQGKWKELRGTFTPDGHISVSWFRGPFEQFVERCRAGFGASRGWSRHHLFASTITLDKDRAIAETPVIIRVRQKFGAVEADLTSFSRFLDRVERRGDGWLIAERAAIYERDRLDPVEPSPAFECIVRSRRDGALSRTIPLHGVSARACRRPLAGARHLSRWRHGNG